MKHLKPPKLAPFYPLVSIYFDNSGVILDGLDVTQKDREVHQEEVISKEEKNFYSLVVISTSASYVIFIE